MGGITTTLFQRPRDPNFNQTTLLLSGNFPTNGAQNNTFLDSSSNAFSITRNPTTGPNAPTQGTFSPFSQTGWSNFFDGNDYLTVAGGSSLAFGSGDFSLEAFVYPTASGSAMKIYDGRPNTTAGNYPVFERNASNVAVFYVDTTALITGTTVIQANTWTHVLVSRVSGNLRLFVNGVQDGSTVSNSTNFANGTARPAIAVRGSSLANDFFTGYISNVRVITGSGFTSVTVPTTPLTTVSGTLLLTCQSNRFFDSGTANSGSGFAVTAVGNPSVQAFSPFAPSGAYTTTAVGGSGYFDGTGDYLSIADNDALDMEAQNFTFECWIYPVTAPSGSSQFIFTKRATTGTFGGFAVFFTNSLAPRFQATVNGSSWGVSITSTVLCNRYAWNHIAAVRSGNDWTLYVNGASGGTVNLSGTIPTNTSPVVIGAGADGGTQNIFESYIASARLVKGTAVYTAAFTPPTAPPTPIANTSILLNFTNAGIVDSTAKNVLETVGNAQISTTQSKFGGTSMSFDGTGDYLNILTTNQSLTLGSANWTIEFWIYLPSLPNTRKEILYLNGNTSGFAAMSVHICSNNKLGLSFSESGSAWKTDDTTGIGNALTVTTWQHVAVTRNGQNIQVYLDGVSQGATYTTTAATTSLMTTYTLNQVCAYNSTSFQLNAYLDDLRVTVGVARYTANFNVPTIGFTDR